MDRAWKKNNPFTALGLALGLVYSLSQCWRSLLNTGWDTVVVLLALGVLLAWHVLKAVPGKVSWPYRLVKPNEPVQAVVDGPEQLVVKWRGCWGALGQLAIFCVVSLLAFERSIDWRFAWPLLLLLLALSCYLTGIWATFLFSAPLLLLVVILPLQEPLFLCVSQPLRQISTILSVETLQLLGVSAEHKLTTIVLPGAELRITDAYNGIQQLKALLLVGYLLVRYQQNALWWGVVHYALVVPAGILSNILRLLATVFMYRRMGESVLWGRWHDVLGYIQVAAAVGILWLFGQAIAALARKDSEKMEKNNEN